LTGIRLSRLLTCTCVCLASAVAAAASDQSAQVLVRRGIEALHWFEYEQANDLFRAAQAEAPSSVLPVWGEAMTYDQVLWRNEDVAAARRILSRLGATGPARLAKARTARERMLLAAVEARFGDGDSAARRQRYADAMGRLYAAEPDDPDVAAFYALSLLGTMSRSLIGYVDAHEGHSASLAGSATQSRVSEILNKVLESHPHHPGALHYLLHNDDDPAHARDALDAARALARLAPDASHALHMPSHIFLQLGLWEEAAASDAAAFRASTAWVTRTRRPQTLRNYHALAWLEYERLQQGRSPEARATLEEIEPIVKSTGDLNLLSDLSSMRARYVVETASWTLLANADNFGNVNELFALGMSAARAGSIARAERARQLLADKQHDEREGDLRPAIAIMERELAAVIAFAAGRHDEAIATMRVAADAERQLPAPLGLPVPIKPAPELLGEMLLDAGRAGEAVEAFNQALARYANRAASVSGLARANASFAAAGAPPPSPAQPPRWVGLFTSPGGLLIIALAAGAIVITWLLASSGMSEAGTPQKKGKKPIDRNNRRARRER
jgi:tetratricopeptide (TPR) repeat protein